MSVFNPNRVLLRLFNFHLNLGKPGQEISLEQSVIQEKG